MLDVLFYCESLTVGGHEMMALAATRAINRSGAMNITWLVDQGNERLVAALDAAGICFHKTDLSPRFSALRGVVSSYKKIKQVARLIRSIHPALVVIVQGGIKESFDGAICSTLLRQAFCSYIPMTHSSRDLPAYRLPMVRNFVRSLYYRAIPRYVTIDNEQANQLRSFNPRADVLVVENYLAVQNNQPSRDKIDLRSKLGIAAGTKLLGVFGRIEFGQKCQDWVVEQVSRPSWSTDRVVLFVGDGPDAGRLADKIVELGVSDRCKVLGWQADMRFLYQEIDALLIPSRVEGVPLVMLEALAAGKPVAASDRDGMKTWLPRDWRFSFKNEVEMAKAVDAVLGQQSLETWEAIREKLTVINDGERFRRDFARAIACWAHGTPDESAAIDAGVCI